MKVKFSALVSDMRGKLNGSVASRNRGGSYLRNKTTPVNPQTPRQQLYRSQFGAVSSSWRALSEAVRQSYKNGAEAFPYIDIFGDSRQLSGAQFFQKTALNRLKVLPDIPLTPFQSPAGFPPFSDDINLAIDETSAEIVINGTVEGVSLSMVLVVYATPVLGAGVSFAKNQFRLIETINETTIGEPIDISVAWAQTFGALPASGRLQVRVAYLDVHSGLMSAPLVLDELY